MSTLQPCLILPCCLLILFGGIFINSAAGQAGLPQFNNSLAAREQLIREVLIPGGVTDERVLAAIRATARHEFVPPNVRRRSLS